MRDPELMGCSASDNAAVDPDLDQSDTPYPIPNHRQRRRPGSSAQAGTTQRIPTPISGAGLRRRRRRADAAPSPGRRRRRRHPVPLISSVEGAPAGDGDVASWAASRPGGSPGQLRGENRRRPPAPMRWLRSSTRWRDPLLTEAMTRAFIGNCRRLRPPPRSTRVAASSTGCSLAMVDDGELTGPNDPARPCHRRRLMSNSCSGSPAAPRPPTSPTAPELTVKLLPQGPHGTWRHQNGVIQ